MYNIAIVDDDKFAIETLRKYLERMIKEDGVDLTLRSFSDGEELLGGGILLSMI